jgi:N-acetylglucosamine-6-phosphate deacetylase
VSEAPSWLCPAQVFDGDRLHAGVALRIENGTVSDLAPAAQVLDGATPVERSDCIVCPAFVDLQVNGGGGALFNNDPTPATIATIARAHRLGGTGAWFPALITTTPQVMTRAVDSIIEAHGQHGVMGLHIEGPHISAQYRGTHALEHIRAYDDHTRELVRRLRARDIPVILTLAPECIAADSLSELIELGVNVSIGHSGASPGQTREALSRGVNLFTHLFNGMPKFGTKDVGMAGVALDSAAWCGIIADGFHVDDLMIKLAVRAKRGPGAVFAVTDAMATVHGPPEFELYGATLRLRDGKLIDSRGSLAGVHIDMIGTLRRLVRNVGLSLEAALSMVTSNPARAVGLHSQVGVIRKGAAADLLLIEPDTLTIKGYIGVPYSRSFRKSAIT